MTEKPHQPCPYKDCGSSDAFSFNAEGFGFCHSCNEGYPSKKRLAKFPWVEKEYPILTREKQLKFWEVEPKEVSYEDIRGLEKDVAKLYQIQAQYDDKGLLFRYAIKWPSTVQYRKITDSQEGPKYKSKSGTTFNKHLGGPDFNAGSSKKLYLTEGMIDAATLYQVLGKSYPVKALPSASVSDDFIKTNHEYLSAFENIIYAGELDKAGKKAADRLYTAYPEKFYFVPMTKWKDANEFLENGDAEELKWAALKPQRYSPDNFFCSDQEFIDILREENPYESVATGLKGLDHMTRGMVKGGVTFIKAPPGSGKTEIIRKLCVGMLKDHSDVKVAGVFMEEMRSLTLRAFATYELGINVRTREDALGNGVTEKEVEDAALRMAQGDRTILFEMRSTDEPTQILEYISLAARIYGANYIFIDHVQRLVYRGGTDNATNMLTQIASNCAELAKELNIGIIFISHMNKEGGTKYASALEEEAIIVIEISRDKTSEDEVERNTTTLEVTKNRPFSRLGYAGKLFYDSESTLLSEVEEEV